LNENDLFTVVSKNNNFGRVIWYDKYYYVYTGNLEKTALKLIKNNMTPFYISNLEGSIIRNDLGLANNIIILDETDFQDFYYDHINFRKIELEYIKHNENWVERMYWQPASKFRYLSTGRNTDIKINIDIEKDGTYLLFLRGLCGPDQGMLVYTTKNKTQKINNKCNTPRFKWMFLDEIQVKRGDFSFKLHSKGKNELDFIGIIKKDEFNKQMDIIKKNMSRYKFYSLEDKAYFEDIKEIILNYSKDDASFSEKTIKLQLKNGEYKFIISFENDWWAENPENNPPRENMPYPKSDEGKRIYVGEIWDRNGCINSLRLTQQGREYPLNIIKSTHIVSSGNESCWELLGNGDYIAYATKIQTERIYNITVRALNDRPGPVILKMKIIKTSNLDSTISENVSIKTKNGYEINNIKHGVLVLTEPNMPNWVLKTKSKEIIGLPINIINVAWFLDTDIKNIKIQFVSKYFDEGSKISYLAFVIVLILMVI